MVFLQESKNLSCFANSKLLVLGFVGQVGYSTRKKLGLWISDVPDEILKKSMQSKTGKSTVKNKTQPNLSNDADVFV